MRAQYLHDLGDDVLALRRPIEERYRRGVLVGLFAPGALLVSFWAPVLALGPGPLWLWLGGGALVSLVAAILALAGAALLVTGKRRAGRDLVRFDLAERLIERANGPADVLRTPDAVVVRPRRLGWVLGLRSGAEVHELLRAPRGAGRALAQAAEELAERLEVDAEIAKRAPHATGLSPTRREGVAALMWSPLDGVNVAYALWALWTSDDEWLRSNARQALGHLAVEALMAVLLFGTLLVPTLAMDGAPGAVLVFLLLPLGGAYALRAGLRSYVAYRAYSGERWPAPWIGWVYAPKALARPAQVPPRRSVHATQVGAPW